MGEFTEQDNSFIRDPNDRLEVFIKINKRNMTKKFSRLVLLACRKINTNKRIEHNSLRRLSKCKTIIRKRIASWVKYLSPFFPFHKLILLGITFQLRETKSIPTNLISLIQHVHFTIQFKNKTVTNGIRIPPNIRNVDPGFFVISLPTSKIS